jgi:hypothetical protein
VLSVSQPPSGLEPGGAAESSIPSRDDRALPSDPAPAAEPSRLVPMLVRTVLLAIAAILLVYAVLPLLLQRV